MIRQLRVHSLQYIVLSSAKLEIPESQWKLFLTALKKLNSFAQKKKKKWIAAKHKICESHEDWKA